MGIFLCIVFFLPTQFGIHFWPEYSFVSGLRIDYLSPALYFTDILIGLLLITKLLERFIFGVGRRINQRPNGLGFWMLIVIFLIVLLVGVVFSASPLAGLFSILKIAEFIILGTIAVKIIAREKIHRLSMLAFALGMLLQSLIAIGQFYNQGSLGSIFYFLGERTFNSGSPGIANASLNGALILRPYGTLPHPNVLAGYLLIGLVWLTASGDLLIVKGKKIFIYSVVILSVIALVLSMSRYTIFIGLLLAIFIYKKNNSTIRKRLRLILIILVILGLILSPLLFYRYTAISLNDESVLHRTTLSKASIQMFLDYPLFGVGLSNFLIRLPGYISLLNIPIQPVHNIYFLIMAESGLIGLSIVVILVYRFIKKAGIATNSLFSGAGIILLAIILLGLNDHYLITLQQGKLLLTLSISIIYARSKLLSA